MDDRWLGNEFQIFEATDEKRFGGCDGGFTWGNTYRQNWSRAECSRRYIFWDERCKIGWLLKLEYPESNRSDFKANSVANRKPMQIRKNRCNVGRTEVCCATTRARAFWTCWRRVRFETDVPDQERVEIIKSRANYCYSYGFRSLSSKRSTDVTQRFEYGKNKPYMFQTPAYQIYVLHDFSEWYTII